MFRFFSSDISELRQEKEKRFTKEGKLAYKPAIEVYIIAEGVEDFDLQY